MAPCGAEGQVEVELLTHQHRSAVTSGAGGAEFGRDANDHFLHRNFTLFFFFIFLPKVVRRRLLRGSRLRWEGLVTRWMIDSSSSPIRQRTRRQPDKVKVVPVDFWKSDGKYESSALAPPPDLLGRSWQANAIRPIRQISIGIADLEADERFQRLRKK